MSVFPNEVPKCAKARLGIVGPGSEENQRLNNRKFEASVVITGTFSGGKQQKQQIEEAVWSNPALKEFRDAEGTEPEMAAYVVDLVKTFQQILDRARHKPSFNVDDD